MTEYEYGREILEGVVGVDPDEDVTVELPDDAVGITLRTFGDDVWVRYLVPVEDVDLTEPERHPVADGGIEDDDSNRSRDPGAEHEDSRDALPDGGNCYTIVGDTHHPGETHPPGDDTPVTDGGEVEEGDA